MVRDCEVPRWVEETKLVLLFPTSNGVTLFRLLFDWPNRTVQCMACWPGVARDSFLYFLRVSVEFSGG